MKNNLDKNRYTKYEPLRKLSFNWICHRFLWRNFCRFQHIQSTCMTCSHNSFCICDNKLFVLAILLSHYFYIIEIGQASFMVQKPNQPSTKCHHTPKAIIVGTAVAAIARLCLKPDYSICLTTSNNFWLFDWTTLIRCDVMPILNVPMCWWQSWTCMATTKTWSTNCPRNDLPRSLTIAPNLSFGPTNWPLL